MSQRLFLSAVTDQYAPLRISLGTQLRSDGLGVVQQDEFVEIGVNTLVKLAEFIEHESDIVLHLTGWMVGNVPPVDVASELLRHCGEDRLRERFPKLFNGDAFGRVTYTQWEAWLGLFYGKRVLSFLADDALSGGEPA